MTDERLILAERIGQAVLAAEQEAANFYGIDDRQHIPRSKRIAETVAVAAGEQMESEEVESQLAEDLLHYARELYIEACMAKIIEGEDPEEWREESEEIFQENLAPRQDLT